jgi:hypothetical protein
VNIPIQSSFILSRVKSDSRRGFGLEARFIDHFNTRLVTTLNYSVIANFHTSQITAAHTKSFMSAVTYRFPVTVLNNGDSSTLPIKSPFHRLP